MKTIHFSNSLKDRNPNIFFGLIEVSEVSVAASRDHFDNELSLLESELQDKFCDSAPSENGVISATRRMYRSAGWEPTKYRPSSEALLRRLIKGSGLYKINNVVDYANLVSARYHIPLGLYDLEKIKGEIFIDIGQEGETYQGISKPLINASGKIILRDDQGVFGNPTADSLRTSIQKETTDVLTVFFVGPGIAQSYVDTMIDKLISYYALFSNPSTIRRNVILPR